MRNPRLYVLIALIGFLGVSIAQDTQVFPVVGWNSWGKISVSGDINSQTITVNGGSSSSSGYGIQRSFSFGGDTLVLNIQGTGASTFDNYKLFKLEVNDMAVAPVEQSRINLNDPEFINAADGTVTFKLPGNINKMQFVFWNCNLSNLQISGSIHSQ